MPDNDSSHPVNADARKLALEAMATLVNVKRITTDLLKRDADDHGYASPRRTTEQARSRAMIRVAFLLAALQVALPVEAKPAYQRWAFMDRKEADATQAGVSDLCFVETRKGNAKQRTPYILDFDGQCRAADSAVHHKKKLRNHVSK